MSQAYVIELYEHGLLVKGDGLPVSDLEAIEALAEHRGWDQLDLGIASAEGAVLALTSKDSSAAWRAAIDARNAHLDAVDRWLAGTDTGVSSRTIAAALTGRRDLLGPFGASVPLDASDFGRCARLLKAVPEFRERLPEVADAYPEWAPLVAVWPELEAQYVAEDWSGMYARLSELRGVS